MIEKLKFPNSKTLFLWDGLGALVSFCLLFFVLAGFPELFGMPKEVLELLYFFAGLCCVLSLFSYFFVRKLWWIFLPFIILANCFYFLLSLHYLIEYFNILTSLGVYYFVSEKFAISLLVILEIRFLVQNFSSGSEFHDDAWSDKMDSNSSNEFNDSFDYDGGSVDGDC